MAPTPSMPFADAMGVKIVEAAKTRVVGRLLAMVTQTQMTILPDPSAD